jgi:hypothetical protein
MNRTPEQIYAYKYREERRLLPTGKFKWYTVPTIAWQYGKRWNDQKKPVKKKMKAYCRAMSYVILADVENLVKIIEDWSFSPHERINLLMAALKRRIIFEIQNEENSDNAPEEEGEANSQIINHLVKIVSISELDNSDEFSRGIEMKYYLQCLFDNVLNPEIQEEVSKKIGWDI